MMKSERGEIESDKIIKGGTKRMNNSLKSQIQVCKYSDTKNIKIYKNEKKRISIASNVQGLQIMIVLR